MRVLMLASALALSFGSNAFAGCLIYSEPSHEYRGNVITLGGNAHAGVYPGANDGTPYAGSLKGNVVYLGEKNPVKSGTVKGNAFYDNQGKRAFTFENNLVKNEAGTVVATTEAPYTPGNFCEADVALAGVVMFGAHQ